MKFIERTLMLYRDIRIIAVAARIHHSVDTNYDLTNLLFDFYFASQFFNVNWLA